ncbi:FAD-dependent hydroxylase [Synechococcus elongatus]|uniref:2-octaprenyl-3-methyl-6-methoxy-1,4-benzoquinol hydroxylase n=2 Tax=Synechococcus elongatus TaxID=32046 RepID=Q31LI4_SYNE7|nr:FAD-dependent hydroxylase [Synechococcus elongatus]ABB58085.1 2-octaprenyl-3-methyl-6-methoxy-1,4-benzoquinol hydroxylase [Synechococcus elongatus PCC 7942 = FACHB-805]AJD57438.1 2-octaprenyl-6-methoxyphenyl hydroxylase [Synechococcus elongatus UTEX 2973]MBD2586804.1 FAD-dependent hydroxylase [Synechococcus elongatus FACHB-242]MBD2687875.1 FAD-dependent hydroxylase [Synechococcus elongatus FACHB-1061]MBD2706414.1 FAD-dependent hydroxylase [Synechococcus elongatus PCC 7942 = FACHB-805]
MLTEANPTDLVSSRSLTTDVVVVGAGIVGSLVTYGLARQGLRVALVEAQSPAAVLKRDRAYALTLAAADLLEQLGLWETLLPRIQPFQEIQLSDTALPKSVRLLPKDLQRSQSLGYVAEHRVLLETLYEQFESLPNLTWLPSTQLLEVNLDTHQATLLLERDGIQQQWQSQLVVAADGPNSPLREACGIRRDGWAYWQSCLTAVVGLERSHQGVAQECFRKSGPFAVLPLPGDRAQIVWTAPHAQAQQLRDLPESEFLQQLRQPFGDRYGQLRLLSDRRIFPVQLRQSRRYVQHRLALVGDAAHCCHPVGGQGLNLGIQDAGALIETLTSDRRRRKDLGRLSLLQRYERRRKRETWLILGFTDLLDRLFSNHFWPLVQLRRLGLWLLRHVPLLRTLALKVMTGQWVQRIQLKSH